MITDAQMKEAGPPTRFDNTMFANFESCRRSFYWFWRGLTYKSIPPYFTFGNAFQKGLEAWYLTPGPIEDRLAAAFTAAERRWTEDSPIERPGDTLMNLKWLLTFYSIEYSSEPWEILSSGKEIELGFEFPLRGTEFYLTGALDGYITWEPYGQLVLEDKTTGSWLSDSYLNQWKHSGQVTQYLWGLTQVLPEEPFGVLMNIVCKRLTQKAITEFKSTGISPDNLFARSLEKRSAFELEEFELGALELIQEIRAEWDTWNWRKTKNQLNCSGGMGKSTCPYRRLCLAQAYPWELGESDQALLGNDLAWRDGPWEPWLRGKEEKK